jgi:hypothetical protein
VVFTEYFMHPDSMLSEFACFQDASDIFADGIPLTVADLQYLIRIINGDAMFDPCRNDTLLALQLNSQTTADQLRIDYDSPVDVGIVYLVLECSGQIGTPMLETGASYMDIKYIQDGNEVRILIYNIGSETIDAGSGSLLTIPFTGALTLRTADAADYYGCPLNIE